MNIPNVTAALKKQDAVHFDKKWIMNQQSDSSAQAPAEKEQPEEDRGVVLELSEDLKEMYQEQLEAAKEAAKAAGEGMEDMAKIIEIARRISRGDKVPPSDEKKLMEFDSDLYQVAKAAAALHAKEKRKEHDALFEDETEHQDEKLRELKREDSSRRGSRSEAAVVEEAAAAEE